MKLCFELSMPNRGSWDGRWSGESNLYARVVNIGRSKAAREEALKILEKGYYRYSFGDGWSAGITVKAVDAKEAARIRRASKGFCGYDWMIDSIRKNGAIVAPSAKATGGAQ